MDETKTVHLPEGDWVEAPLTMEEKLSKAEGTVRRQREEINAIRHKVLVCCKACEEFRGDAVPDGFDANNALALIIETGTRLRAAIAGATDK